MNFFFHTVCRHVYSRLIIHHSPFLNLFSNFAFFVSQSHERILYIIYFVLDLVCVLWVIFAFHSRSISRFHPLACDLSSSSYSWSSFLYVSLCHPSPALLPAHWPPGIGVCVCVYRGHLSRQLPGIWPSHPRSCGNLSSAERFIHLFIVQISSHLCPRHASLVDPYRIEYLQMRWERRPYHIHRWICNKYEFLRPREVGHGRGAGGQRVKLDLPSPNQVPFFKTFSLWN